MVRVGAIGTFLFLVSFGLFVHRAFPSVSAGDAGEFATAATTLAVPHPSGFPTYTLLAHGFQTCFPFANPAYQTNLFSALCGALGVWMLFGLLLRCGVRTPFAAASAILLLGVRAHQL